jgi:hypothetical protein
LATQAAQIQALLRAASGTCFSKSALKGTRVHQQGAVASAPTLGVAMAQALGCPHKGQWQGSMARGAVMSPFSTMHSKTAPEGAVF